MTLSRRSVDSGKPTSLLLLDGLLGCFFFDGGDFDFVMGVGGAVGVDAHEPPSV